MGKGKVILFVDDEEKMIRDLTRILEREGYTVAPYTGSQRAFEEINDGLRFDLAIIDRSLPRISGDDLIDSIKEKDRRIPIICLSGYGDSVRGANCCLLKPVLTKELLKRIEVLLR